MGNDLKILSGLFLPLMSPPPFLFTIIKCMNLFNLQHPTLLPSRPVMFFFGCRCDSSAGKRNQKLHPGLRWEKVKTRHQRQPSKASAARPNKCHLHWMSVPQLVADSCKSTQCCWSCLVLWDTRFALNFVQFSKVFCRFSVCATEDLGTSYFLIYILFLLLVNTLLATVDWKYFVSPSTLFFLSVRNKYGRKGKSQDVSQCLLWHQKRHVSITILWRHCV